MYLSNLLESGTLLVRPKCLYSIDELTNLGALGIPSIGFIPHHPALEYTFVDTMVAPNVQHAFQALALDEHRLPFTPTIWETPSGRTDLDLRQCWFPGVHANIGGGYPDTMAPDLTLAWMISTQISSARTASTCSTLSGCGNETRITTVPIP